MPVSPYEPIKVSIEEFNNRINPISIDNYRLAIWNLEDADLDKVNEVKQKINLANYYFKKWGRSLGLTVIYD